MDSFNLQEIVTCLASGNTQDRKILLKKLQLKPNTRLREEIEIKIEEYLQNEDFMSENASSCFSHLIVETKNMKDILSTFVPTLLHKILITLSHEEEEDLMCKNMKLCLQIFQHYRPELQVENAKLQENLKKITQKVLKFVTMDGAASYNLNQLCGTVIGYMLDYFADINIAAKSFICLINNRTSEQDFTIEVFPGLHLDANHYIGTTTSNLWIIIGVLSCCDASILLQSYSSIKALDLCFDKLLKCCKNSDPVIQFHGYRGMLLWCKCCKKLSPQDIKEHFAQNSLIVENLLKLVLENWDSPIKGVLEMVLFILECTLHLNQQSTSSSELLEKCIDFALSTSVYVKGRYSVLSILMAKYGSLEFLERNSTFLCDIIPCLGVNHLAPVVSRICKACIQDCKTAFTCDDVVANWKQYLAPSLVKALLHDSTSISNNALHYWVTMHLSLHPKIYKELLSQLHVSQKNDESYLSAVLGVMKCARSTGQISFYDLDIMLLKQGLVSFDPDIRANAWTVLCKAHKPSEPIDADVFELIKRNLLLNMNSDCASFRNHLIFCVSNFLQRVFVTMIASQKKVNKQSLRSYTDDCLDFLHWFVEETKANLCGSYQRKQTALNLFVVLLKSLLCNDTTKSRKAIICQSDVDSILQLMESNSMTLTSSDDAMLFIELLDDVVPEIRDTSLKILKTYFSPHILRHHATELRHKVSRLSKSPRLQDAESASSLSQLHFYSLYCIGTRTSDEICNCSNDYLSYLDKEVLLNIKEDFSKLRQNFYQGSFSNPLFGWILVLSKCCDQVANSFPFDFSESTSEGLSDFLSLAVDHLIEIVNYILTTIFSCISGTSYNASADFQEITSRIMQIIHNCKQTDPSQNFKHDPLLQTDHEVILACSWLCIKNANLALTSIALLCMQLHKKHQLHSNILVAEKICKTYVTVLMWCRHRGVVESCSECLNTVSSNLFSSSDKKLQSIPVAVLKEVVRLFETNYDDATIVPGGTITRRAAGLPLITEAILSSSVSSKTCCNLLEQTIKVMIKCTENFLQNSKDFGNQLGELPVVHALYILKHLFKNTSLSKLVLPFAVKLFKLSISCLGHIWIVRNAATHLLGAVSSKMLGQKHIEAKCFSSTKNSLSAVEFFSWYPELLEFMVEVLQANNKNLMSLSNSLAVYPILSILSKLSNNKTTSDERFKLLSKQLQTLLGSPCYATRTQTANAVVGLHSWKDTVSLTTNFMQSIPCDKSKNNVKVPQNLLHGWLEVISRIIDCDEQKSNDPCLQLLYQTCIERQWIAIHAKNPCLFTAAIFVKILRKIKQRNPDKSKNFDLSAVVSFLKQALKQNDACMLSKVGGEIYLKETIRFVVPSLDAVQLGLDLQLPLNSSKNATNEVVLTGFVEHAKHNAIGSAMLQEILTCLFPCQERKMTNHFLELIIFNWKQIESFNDDTLKTRTFQKVAELLCKKETLSSTCLSLKAFSICLISQNATSNLSFSNIKLWIKEVARNTCLTRASEPLRLASAKSLAIAGGDVLRWLKYQSDSDGLSKDQNDCAALLYRSSIYLINDEQPTIRKEACTFVSKLCNNSVVHFHNPSLLLVLNDAVSRFPANIQILEMLCQSLIDVKVKFSRANLDLFEQENFNPFWETKFIAITLLPYVQEILTQISQDVVSQWIAVKIKTVQTKLELLLENTEPPGNSVWKESVFCVLSSLNLFCYHANNKHLINQTGLNSLITRFKKIGFTHQLAMDVELPVTEET